MHITLGKRVGATIRQLGYPIKNALKGWYREFEHRLDLSPGYARSKPKYSQAHKAAAGEHYVSHDRCIAATMRALGYPGRGTLSAWDVVERSRFDGSVFKAQINMIYV